MRSLLFPIELPPQAAGSLSLQFFIHELLRAFQWHKTSASEKTPSIEYIASHLEQALALSSNKKSFLDQMYDYLHILFQNASLGYQRQIVHRLDTLKSLVYELHSQIPKIYKKRGFTPALSPNASWQTTPADLHAAIQELTVATWDKLLQTTQEHLKLLFGDLLSFIQEFQHDENLLFLLIEQKDPLNQYLGDRVIETLFSRLFPQGSCTLREALYNGYARRGFLDFYARHEKLIESIDWDQPCPLADLKPSS